MKDRYVALLRGINVGGKNKLPMQTLIALLPDCSEVVTYIQSGNIVFSASAKVARALPVALSQRIKAKTGLDVPVVTRSAAELREAVAKNPYKKRDPDRMHVMFLADERKGELDPNRSPGDEFTLLGRDLYLYLPNGAARTKLTNAYFDSRLKTVGTMRNWRTVLKLLELTTPA